MRLVWGLSSQRPYETGIDRGVLYPSDGPGVVWNGLRSVDESFDGGELSSYHFDGLKYRNHISSKHFKATIKAYTAPDEFDPCVGDIQVGPGLTLTRQPRSRFGLSYRTLIGDNAYKIHLIYNALASPSNHDYSTTGSSVVPSDLSWVIDALPLASDTNRPTAHYILDSTKIEPAVVAVIEKLLYGSSTSEPELPSLDKIINYLAFFSSLVISPNELTGIALLNPVDDGDLSGTAINGIYQELPSTRLVESIVDGIYTLE